MEYEKQLDKGLVDVQIISKEKNLIKVEGVHSVGSDGYAEIPKVKYLPKESWLVLNVRDGNRTVYDAVILSLDIPKENPVKVEASGKWFEYQIHN